jgi:uncharacterized protein (TIGR03118 family)
VIFNSSSTSFPVAAGKPASFLFCTEDGTISGWNSSVDATNAKIPADNSKSGAVYKGCAMGSPSGGGPMIYAANFNSGAIDVWDANFNAVKNLGFANPMVAAGFAPFNVQNIGGTLYVTYAKQDAAKHDDVPGAGNGFVAAFDLSGNLRGNLVSQGPLNSPWGLAIAPASFGDFAGTLLAGNFGDGSIHAFDATSGTLKGTLNDTKGNPISIKGLWSLNFGNGGRGGDTATLYFAAGINGPNGDPVESHGLFGSIQPAPFFQTTGVLNGASFSSSVTANAWVSIKGGALSATTRGWQTADFTGNKLPIQLDGVGITVNGEAAAVSFISPAQINFLAPADIPAGPAQIQVINNGLASATISATVLSAAPAFFTFGASNSAGNMYIAATHADGSLGAPPSLITGATTTPFKVGETIVLYGDGFGPTSPPAPNGVILPSPLPLSPTPTVNIGGLPAIVQFAGLSATGLYQFNVVVPLGLKPGEAIVAIDVPVSIQIGGASTQSNAVISVLNPVPST